MNSPFVVWDHIEYKNFGDISTYQDVLLDLHDYGAENSGKQAEIIKATMRLPSCCLVDGEIYYDGNFANGNIKIGSPPSNYNAFGNGETIKENKFYSFDSFAIHPLTGEKYTMVETQENQVGGYYKTQKFVRYIGDGPGVIEAKINLLQYVIDLGGGYMTYMYFYVSPKATVEDLEIYDAIAKSVKIIQ